MIVIQCYNEGYFGTNSIPLNNNLGVNEPILGK